MQVVISAGADHLTYSASVKLGILQLLHFFDLTDSGARGGILQLLHILMHLDIILSSLVEG